MLVNNFNDDEHLHRTNQKHHIARSKFSSKNVALVSHLQFQHSL